MSHEDTGQRTNFRRLRTTRCLARAPSSTGRGPGTRLRRFLFTPRPLQWNIAGLTAAVGLVAIVVVAPLLIKSVPADPGIGAVNVATVRFEYHAPGARQVALAGDFNQ